MAIQESTDESAIYLTNLDRCQPASSLSTSPRRHSWLLQPYETSSVKGTLLSAGEETAAPEVTLALDRSGWHRIDVGVYPEHRSRAAVEVKLSDDAAFSLLHVGADSGASAHGHHIHELRWKEADLTGQTLTIRQVCTATGKADEPASARCERTRLAYIKLVPLSDADVEKLNADRRQTGTHTLFAHNDAHGYLYLFGSATEEAVRREIEPYRHTDFSRIYWECGAGDLMFYLGKAGRLPTCDGIDDFERQGDRLHAETWRSFRQNQLDPLDIALNAAHEIGMEFHASYRTAGFFFPAPLEQWNPGSLYFERPDLRMVGKDGRIAPRISYAFPDARRFVIDLLSEVAGKPIDGVCILYNRRPPLVGYEPPLVESFIADHGEDPRRLDDNDDRWLVHRCSALTDFHRELRAALDTLSDEEGRERIAVSACVMNRVENELNGLDLKTWIDEGIVDTLIPYTSAPALDSGAEAWTDEDEVRYFVNLTDGTNCQLALNIMPRHMAPEAFNRKAADLYALGVEQLFFWDSAGSSGRANYSAGWDALRRLGHREEIEEWVRQGEPELRSKIVPLLRVGDYDLTYQTPG